MHNNSVSVQSMVHKLGHYADTLSFELEPYSRVSGICMTILYRSYAKASWFYSHVKEIESSGQQEKQKATGLKNRNIKKKWLPKNTAPERNITPLIESKMLINI